MSGGRCVVVVLYVWAVCGLVCERLSVCMVYLKVKALVGVGVMVTGVLGKRVPGELRCAREQT